MNKLHELTGKIISKELRKVYNKDSEFYGNSYYRLGIIIDQQKEPDYLFVYPNLVKAEIFRVIEKSQYVDKRYLFFCEKKPKRWVLHNWRELANNTQKPARNHE